MALYSMRTGKVSTGALAAAAAKSLILLNPVTAAGMVCEMWLSMGASAEQADIAFEFYRTTTLGTPAGTTGTAVKYDPTDATPSWTGLINLTTEPTAVEVLQSGYVPVAKGLAIVQWPLGREPIGAAAGQRLGLRVVNDGGAAMTAVNARCTVVWDE
jgi:hypothetical protein